MPRGGGVALRRHRARRVPGRGRERDAGQVSEEGVRGAPSAGTRGSWPSRHVLCNDIRLRYGEPSVKTPLGSHRVRRGWSCRQRHDEEKVLFVQRLLWRKTLLPRNEATWSRGREAKAKAAPVCFLVHLPHGSCSAERTGTKVSSSAWVQEVSRLEGNPAASCPLPPPVGP